MAATERPLRSDAERNRRRILEAARVAFAECGLEVSMDEIARRAGVGVGTVYRRFPDKEVLIEALFEDRLDTVLALARETAAMEDAWEGLVEFFTRSLELQVADRGLKDLLFSTAHGRDRVAAMREHIGPVVDRLVERGKEQGRLRADVDPHDVPLLHHMLGAVVEYTRDVRPDAWRRYVVLVLDGLRARRDDATALPAASLGDAELDAAMAAYRPPARRTGPA